MDQTSEIRPVTGRHECAARTSTDHSTEHLRQMLNEAADREGYLLAVVHNQRDLITFLVAALIILVCGLGYCLYKIATTL